MATSSIFEQAVIDSEEGLQAIAGAFEKWEAEEAKRRTRRPKQSLSPNAESRDVILRALARIEASN